MLKRYLLSSGLAIVVTFGLFFLMQSLITMSKTGIDEIKGGRVIDFVRLKRDESLQVKKRELPQKVAPKSQPPPPALDLPTNPGDLAQGMIGIAPPALDSSLGITGGPSLGGISSDADVIPLVRIEPTYPPRAAAKRIEGWVRVEFGISATGAVKDARVIASDPPGIFDRAALRGIRRWKYKPKIEDGVPVERHGIRVQLAFDLPDDD